MSIQQTGQRGISASNEVDTSDELLAEKYFSSQRLDMTATDGADLPADGFTGGYTWMRAPILGDNLKPHQIAELVSLDVSVHTIFLQEQSGAGTTPGSVWSEAEFSRRGVSNQPRILRSTDTEIGWDPEGNVASGDADVDSFGGAKGFIETTNFAGRIAYTNAVMHTGFADTVGGTGGGGAVDSSAPQHFQFRRDYGRGPVFESDDEFKLTGAIRWNQVENQIIRCIWSANAYWDVFEYERGELTEVKGDTDVLG